MFFGVSALLFAASAAATIVWCASMSAMGEMAMPGAAASLLGMWVVMMVAMMLPSLFNGEPKSSPLLFQTR
jgi:predicted metal-binding membrane protein